MSIILNLSPELEARLRADAERLHVPIEVLAITKLHSLYPAPPSEEERLALLDELQGCLAGTGFEMEDFLNEKHADVERENARDWA